MKKTPPTNKPQPLPDVKFHPGLPERLMEAAALLLVVVNWGYIIYMRLAHGNENFTAACVMGVTATISFIIVALCAYVPVKLINFPSPVTPTNIVTQYVLAVRFIRVINIIMGITYLATTLVVYHEETAFLYTSIGLLILSTIIYIVIAMRQR